jgi:hypothetical protein
MNYCDTPHPMPDTHGTIDVIGCDTPLSRFPPGKAPHGWVWCFHVYADTQIVHHGPRSEAARQSYEGATW